MIAAASFVAGLVGVDRPADAQNRPLELGVFVPRLYFQNAVARARYARQLASTLARATGRPIRGRAFSRWDDLVSFHRAGRLDLALTDAATVLNYRKQFDVLARGVGPEGRSPRYAVLSRKKLRGIRPLKGKPLALVRVVPSERTLLSNYVLEAEVNIRRFFGTIRVASDLVETLSWVRVGRAECTLAYAAHASRFGLKVAAKLRGMPLPLLVGVKGRLTAEDKAKLRRAVAKSGLSIPNAAPMTKLVSADKRVLTSLIEATSRGPGQRRVQRAIWSTAPVARLNTAGYRVKAARRPVPRLQDTYWHRPKFKRF